MNLNPVPGVCAGNDVCSVRLSDGGGAENLGLVSLIRRGLSDVIIADAAQDGGGTMKHLCRARELLNQYRITLSFDALENFDEVCDSKKQAYNISDWRNPIIPGKAFWNDTGKMTKLWLIKSAWNQMQVREEFNRSPISCTPFGVKNCLLLAFYGKNLSEKLTTYEETSAHVYPDDFPNKVVKSFMQFPQHSTAGTTLNSSSTLFLAYRELGRSLAAQLQFEEHSGRLDTNIKQYCNQQAYRHRPGHRPGPAPDVLWERWKSKKSNLRCMPVSK